MVLVIDPHGPFGRALVRRLGAAARVVGFDPAEIRKAAVGCRVIAIGGLPARWQDWASVVDAAVEASEAGGQPIVHQVGVDGLKVIYGVPLPPLAPKGEAIDQIGAEGRLANLLEDQLQQHAELRGTRVVLIRSCDLFGPGVVVGFGAEAARAGAAGAALPWYGPTDLPHAFSFVDDVAAVALGVLDLPRSGFEILNAHAFVVDAEAWRTAWGVPRVSPLPHFWVRARGLVDPRWRALATGLWGWEGTILLDDRRTRELLPDWTPTRLESAVATTLAWTRGEDRHAG